MAGSSGGSIRVTGRSRAMRPSGKNVQVRILCFYCKGSIPTGSGRQVLDRADQVRFVHDKHPVRPGERPVPEEQQESDVTPVIQRSDLLHRSGTIRAKGLTEGEVPPPLRSEEPEAVSD